MCTYNNLIKFKTGQLLLVNYKIKLNEKKEEETLKSTEGTCVTFTLQVLNGDVIDASSSDTMVVLLNIFYYFVLFTVIYLQKQELQVSLQCREKEQARY